MNDPVRISLKPLGASFEVERGTPLQDVLFRYGVEFPCGGNALCEGCRIRVLQGTLEVTPEQENVLSAEEIAAGWRLSCRCSATEDLTIELAQWETEVLVDSSSFVFNPREGLGVAVDLGTTTVAAQLLDLQSSNVLAVRTGLNEQARRGADVMTRIGFAVSADGLRELTAAIRLQIGDMVAGLIDDASVDRARLRDIVLVGNTAMHHLFCGIDVTPLAYYPFEPVDDGLRFLTGDELGWDISDECRIRFLPCLGGFVGSDILAGILATGIHESASLAGLIDLGTNGEIVIGNEQRLLCCSTAAGPAFEGSRISMGMRASTGAIAQVTAVNGGLQCRVLGNTPPRGICGSGLVDAVAAGLDTASIDSSGRLSGGAQSFSICPPVVLSQGDIRELQVAKAAIAAGLRILLEEFGASLDDLSKISLAGAFGNYVDSRSARRIGLLPLPTSIIKPAGNTALLGAKIALCMQDDVMFSRVRQLCRHVPLNAHERFQEIYVDEMNFPNEEILQ